MSWDIYGNPLQRGHCEVHPHVAEEYPCSVCIHERQWRQQQDSQCRGNCESGHYLGQAQEHIKELESQRDDLLAALEGVLGIVSAKQARDLADQLEHAAAKLEQMEAGAANTDQEKAL